MSRVSRMRESFFSIGSDSVILDEEIPFDLYINSSGHSERDRFVRIFPKNAVLDSAYLSKFKHKYRQLYILEEQRHDYLKSLAMSSSVPDEKKTEIIKDTAIVYLNNLFDRKEELSTELLEESVAGCRDSVETMIDVVKNYNVNDVQNLIAKLSFHDFYTYDHSINVSMYCISIYKAMKPGASKEKIMLAGLGGLLHDLGKINVPTRIINNPGQISDEDFEIIKRHPKDGKEMLQGLVDRGITFQDIDMSSIVRVVNEHHENVNGTGYPNNLSGDDIHLIARICAIADFFDAITTKRSYSEVVSTEEAIVIMERTVGKKLDEELFKIFKKSATKIIQKRQATRELPEEFDPSIPHGRLPFRKLAPSVLNNKITIKEEENYGKIKTDDNALAEIVKKKLR